MCTHAFLSIMKKNETFIAIGEGYTHDGAGVVHHDGFVFFVPYLIEGEKAEIVITAIKKSYGYGRIIQLLESSFHRINPKCSVYRKCGGCQLMHMDYETQKAFKEDKVRNCFYMNAKMDIDVLPIITTNHIEYYRNKVQVPIRWNGNDVERGFYQKHSNTIIQYDTCYVQSELSNQIIDSITKWLKDYHCVKEIRHILLKHAHFTNEVMVCLIARHHMFEGLDKLIKKIHTSYPEVKSIVLVENRREDNVILDGNEYLLYGNAYIEEELLGSRFRISAKSFFQVNPYATKKLYQTALDYAEIDETKTVIDLYCGTGTIGILASKHAKKVYGIEIVKEAIQDAKKNAELNNVTNIEFMVKDAGAGANELLKRKVQPDIVIVDPPRKGCSPDTLLAIQKMNPEKVVYISCDPATLARDCKILKEYGYEINLVQPVDLFPNSIHVETVVKLSQKHIDHSIMVELDLDEFDETPS
ncbi:MAG: 23S rRNA (uracil(1939)-C(5))-methyltransferase RlmD, partial [Solobacterium sp.]|nr:23S rRNA (uracil(1939)-C(5))-methyltransferase RlmD [Solobacterium sp.]